MSPLRATPPFRLRHVVLLCVLGAMATSTLASTGDRIVAIGDVHGTLDGFERILGSAGLIGDDGRWSGGTAVLVQTGDLMDRGDDVRQVLDLMMRLETEASNAGGRVVGLLGNHEMSNLVGHFDLRSTPSGYDRIASAFADENSEKRRKSAYRSWRFWAQRYPKCAPESRAAWMEAHPVGFLEYQSALAPDGAYGRWLRSRPAAARLGETIFLHGGLSPELEALGVSTLEELNRRVAAELAQWDEDRAFLESRKITPPAADLGDTLCALDTELARLEAGKSVLPRVVAERIQAIRDHAPGTKGWLSFHGDGPLWFRGLAQWDEEESLEEIRKVTETFGVRRIVVGHTPQAGPIGRRFGGLVYLIDTGMVFAPASGYRASALEIEDEQLVAIYEGGREPFAPTSAAAVSPRPVVQRGASGVVSTGRTWLGEDGEPLPFETDREVIQFLRTAEVTSLKVIPIGVNRSKKAVLEKDGIRARAAFRDHHTQRFNHRLADGRIALYFRDSFANEPAAYHLGKLLGLNNIPPATLREVDGVEGSLQLWLEHSEMEVDRRKRGREPTHKQRFERQMYDMRVWDNLIANLDRNQGNMLFDPQDDLWLIDHTRAFSRMPKLTKPAAVVRCSRPFWERLQKTPAGAIRQTLEPYLSRAQIDSLLKRRVHIVQKIEQAIEKGAQPLFDYGEPDDAIIISYEDVPPPPE